MGQMKEEPKEAPNIHGPVGPSKDSGLTKGKI